MNLSTVKWAHWDKTQSRELLGLFICVCITLCTIVAHNIAQNRPDNFPSYPPDNHHCSNDVYLREGRKHANAPGDFACLSFVLLAIYRDRELSSLWLVQSVSWLVRELSSPWVDQSASWRIRELSSYLMNWYPFLDLSLTNRRNRGFGENQTQFITLTTVTTLLSHASYFQKTYSSVFKATFQLNLG